MLQDIVEIKVQRRMWNGLSETLAQVYEVVQTLRQRAAELGCKWMQVLTQPVRPVSHRQKLSGKSLHVVGELVE